jgi:hypothetical protein
MPVKQTNGLLQLFALQHATVELVVHVSVHEPTKVSVGSNSSFFVSISKE